MPLLVCQRGGYNEPGSIAEGFQTSRPEMTMKRCVYIAPIVPFTAPVLLFKVRNNDTATLSLLPVGVHVPGMPTGSFDVGLPRDWLRGARPETAGKD